MLRIYTSHERHLKKGELNINSFDKSYTSYLHAKTIVKKEQGQSANILIYQ